MEWIAEWTEFGDLRPGDTIDWAGLPLRVLNYLDREENKTCVTAWNPRTKAPVELLFDRTYLVQKLGDKEPYKLDGTLTIEEMKARADEDGFIWGIIAVELGDFTDREFEGVLDHISMLLTGTELLSDFGWSVIGHCGDTLHLYVHGDVSMILDGEEDGEEADELLPA